jgi:hypothetical protein
MDDKLPVAEKLVNTLNKVKKEFLEKDKYLLSILSEFGQEKLTSLSTNLEELLLGLKKARSPSKKVRTSILLFLNLQFLCFSLKRRKFLQLKKRSTNSLQL